MSQQDRAALLRDIERAVTELERAAWARTRIGTATTKAELLKLIAALLDASAGTRPDGWQPIKTAPRDRHAIIGLAWNKQVQPIWWSKTYNEWMWADGWHSGQALSMTHWQPLPAPPAGTETEEL